MSETAPNANDPLPDAEPKKVGRPKGPYAGTYKLRKKRDRPSGKRARRTEIWNTAAYRSAKKAEREAKEAKIRQEKFDAAALEVSSVVSEIIATGASGFHIPNNAIVLPARGFKCRHYQEPFWRYMTGKDGRGDGRKKFAVLNWHRRSGKDSVLLNLIAYMTARRKGMYWHAFPLLNQARKAIWEGFMNSEGCKMLEYLPPELREDVNQQELRINLKTGSTYQLVGGDNADKLTGSGPVGIVFSEYAQMKESLWDYTSPILAENDGWVVFISTPRGKNHFHKIYQYALSEPGCFAETLTIEDTYKFDENGNRVPVVDQDYLNRLRRQGKSEEFIQQEFYCSFTSAVEGAVYARQIKECELTNHICEVPHQKHLPVYTAWDLGFRDSTVIIFYQLDPKSDDVFIIDLYFNSQQSIVHYCNVVKSKPYRYQTHYAPWDVVSRTLHSENSVMDIARNNGVFFQRLLKSEVNTGIEAVRAAFPRFWFDGAKCEKLIDAIKAYTYVYDEAQHQFGAEPLHDWASHFCDCLRYLAISLPATRSFILTARDDFNSIPKTPEDTPWDVLNPTPPEYAVR